jgi:hypothetical protein
VLPSKFSQSPRPVSSALQGRPPFPSHSLELERECQKHDCGEHCKSFQQGAEKREGDAHGKRTGSAVHIFALHTRMTVNCATPLLINEIYTQQVDRTKWTVIQDGWRNVESSRWRARHEQQIRRRTRRKEWKGKKPHVTLYLFIFWSP